MTCCTPLELWRPDRDKIQHCHRQSGTGATILDQRRSRHVEMSLSRMKSRARSITQSQPPTTKMPACPKHLLMFGVR